MESFILLFKPYRARLGRCLGLLVCGLLLTQQGWGQIYSADFSSQSFNYFDLSTGTWTAKKNAPSPLYGIAAYQGKVYGIGFLIDIFQVYDPATDTWTAKAASGLTTGQLVTAGNYIYANSASGYSFKRYDPATDSWTSMASLSSSIGATARQLTYDGGNYIYCGFSQGNKAIAVYNISQNTWSLLPQPPIEAPGVAFVNGKLYLVSDVTQVVYVYDPSTMGYTKLANPPSKGWAIIKGDGNYLYSNDYAINKMYRYDISTDTWTTLPTGAFYALTYMGPSCALTASATATQATCASGGGVNANAALTLSSYGGGVTKVGYSAGSSYTGPDFATATAVTTAPMVLSSTLANPTVPQPYTIRLFQDATCYKDVVATLTPTLCLTAGLSLSLSPMTQSGAKGELLTYTLTLNNAGPDAAPDVQVDIKVPTNATLLTAIPQVGTYSEATHKWDISSLPVGSQTLTVTLKMN